MFLSSKCFQGEESEHKRKIEQEKEEIQARSEMQLGVLNENLTTLRADLLSAQNKSDELEKTNNEIRGEKLGW